MAEPKPKPTTASVDAFLARIPKIGRGRARRSPVIEVADRPPAASGKARSTGR
jgi:hypothetical protein